VKRWGLHSNSFHGRAHNAAMRVIRDDTEPPPALQQFVEGVARPRVLVGPEESDEVRVIVASFEPGGHNTRHTHSFDQVLYTISGAGFVATDEDRVVVRPGDVVVIPAGEHHWHGATDDSPLVQLAVGVPGESDFDGQAFSATE
jgi:quercetin dioxygenase-like cupin family protein